MKSVLVTGVCGGIGQALAVLLKEQGWRVFGTDVTAPPQGLAIDQFWKGNVALESFWRRQVVPNLSKLGPLQGFVHNAAIQTCKPIVELTLKEWNETLAVNLTAAFLGIRYLAPLFKDAEGAMVNIASVHAIATSAGMAAYVSSKGGLVALTRAAALELAERRIRINAILPGAVETQMLEQGLLRDPMGSLSARSRLVDRTPLGRAAAPREIAHAVCFLLDGDKSSFITGQTLVVDGGALARLSTE